MPARRWPVLLSLASFVMVPWCSGEIPQSQPAASAAVSAAPSTQPTSEGAVQESMRRLFTVPRSRTAREASAASPQNRKPGKDLPYSRVLPGPDADPSPASDSRERPAMVSSSDRREGGPSDEEIRRAFPNNAPPSAGEAPGGNGASSVAWGRGGYGAPGSRGRGSFRGFGGGPSPYGYNGYPLAPGYSGDGYSYGYGYVKGFNYWRFYDESNARTDRILKNYSGHLAKALELFNRGQYIPAADAFQLASDTHQGDPAARLYTAHALFAIGRYHDAIPYLRRAFELQPRVLFLGFDIRDDYGRRADFDAHLAALESALRQSPNNIDRLILLGYVMYFSHDRERAFQVLRDAYRLDRNDRFVVALMENSRPPDVMLETSSKRP